MISLQKSKSPQAQMNPHLVFNNLNRIQSLFYYKIF